MKEKRTSNLVIVLVIILVALLIIAAGLFFLVTNEIVEGKIYPKNAQVLNLRGREVTVEHYEKVRAKFPNAEIYWNIPIGDSRYPENTVELTLTEVSDETITRLGYMPYLQVVHAEACEDYAQLAKLKEAYPGCRVIYTVSADGQDHPWDAQEIKISSLTDAEVEALGYLTELKTVDATECTDYAQLAALQAQHPECKVNYSVTIAGQDFDVNATEIEIRDAEADELNSLLQYLPNVEKVHLIDPVADGQSLLQLRQTREDLELSWELEFLGVPVSSRDTEVDISGTQPESLDQVAQMMTYIPDAEKLIMTDCGFDNETMAAFRESKRADYKVVWTVQYGKAVVRTDEIFFHPIQQGEYYLLDKGAYNLRYCEDMICVDVGHMALHDLSWVEFMPNLKYLILCQTTVTDITPLSTCKNLIFLELDWTSVKDYSPLLGCTALEDLNLGLSYGDAAPIAQMTWLKNLWWLGKGGATRQMLAEALPNTNLNFSSGTTSGGGWRKLQNYYDMRDIMGMYYM